MDDRNQNWRRENDFYREGGKLYPGGGKTSNGSRFWQILAVACLILLVIFASIIVYLLVGRSSSTSDNRTASIHSQAVTGNTPISTSIPPTATPIPPPSPTPAPSLPCIVNVGSWTGGSSDWKTLNGMLLSDGTNSNSEGGSPTIVAPCQLGNIANYAVETQIQVVSHGYNACFGIDVRGTTTSNGWQGYTGGMYFACGAPSSMLTLATEQSPPWLTDISYDPGTSVHTYRIEVNNNTIKFLIDGQQLLTVTDNQYLSGGQVGLWSYECQLSVSSFKIVAL